ncbi:uncharacterized protein A4U43_C10F17480 [Asparagus officinalis]|uniref:Uncharacterized protein n=1 Tax=Asparagus officinalis TaxID=4686 RepID=A0A5P1E8C0_ASPOF|nr:uncharacterized protein A4U43_C10F17480 [Asparagus officinalis]
MPGVVHMNIYSACKLPYDNIVQCKGVILLLLVCVFLIFGIETLYLLVGFFPSSFDLSRLCLYCSRQPSLASRVFSFDASKFRQQTGKPQTIYLPSDPLFFLDVVFPVHG